METGGFLYIENETKRDSITNKAEVSDHNLTTSDQAVLADLARVKAVFQLRAITAVMGLRKQEKERG